MISPLRLEEYSPTREVRVMKEGKVVTDRVIAEEPLEIVITASEEEEVLATTMRTPGEDLYLALGYLASEGITEKVLRVSRPVGCATPNHNTVILELASFPEGLSHSRRLGVQSSSCGLCGKESIESILKRDYGRRRGTERRWSTEDFQEMRACVLQEQGLFQETGGSHAVWLLDGQNQIVASFEDVGRHNALDKLLGWAALHPREEMASCTLVLSSRLSYELVHKAAVLGIWTVASMGAPSSLAIELANALEMTSVGFFAKPEFNLYTNKQALFFEP